MAAGLASASIMRAVAYAGAALARAFKNSDTPTHYRPVMHSVQNRRAEPSSNISERLVQAPVSCAHTIPEYNTSPIPAILPSSATTVCVSSPYSSAVLQSTSRNSAFIAQAYANSLSEKGKTIADQAARTIADGWNDRVRTNITQAMCQANFRTNGVALDISCWTQPSHTVEMVPGGAIHRYNYGFYSKSSAAAHRRGRSSLAEWLDARQRERLIIMNDSERSYAVKQTIDSFVKNGHKLVFGTLVERVIAALNLPSFYIDGISYGYDLAVAQERL